MKIQRFCLLILLLALAGCASQKPVTQKPSPIIEVAPMTTSPSLGISISATAAIGLETILPCANGQARNLHGNCPAMKPCAKRCTWSTLAPPKQQCLTYLGAGVVTGYDTQTAPDGKACAWVKD